MIEIWCYYIYIYIYIYVYIDILNYTMGLWYYWLHRYRFYPMKRQWCWPMMFAELPQDVWASSAAISGADLLEVPTHLLEAYFCMRLNFMESRNIPRRYGQQIGHKVLVGGIPTPLKNRSSSVGIIIPNSMESHKLPCQWPFQEPKLEVPTIYKAFFQA